MHLCKFAKTHIENTFAFITFKIPVKNNLRRFVAVMPSVEAKNNIFTYKTVLVGKNRKEKARIGPMSQK